MIASPAMVIQKLLVDIVSAEVDDPGATAAVWPLFMSHLPDVEEDGFNNVAAIYDTQGPVPFSTLDGDNQERYGLQLRVRSALYADGWEKIHAICGQLEGVNWLTVNVGHESYRVQTVRQQGTPASLGVEGKKRRSNFTVNFLAWIGVI